MVGIDEGWRGYLSRFGNGGWLNECSLSGGCNGGDWRFSGRYLKEGQ